MTDEPQPEWQPLSVRTGKRPMPPLHEGLPPHLVDVVSERLREQLQETAWSSGASSGSFAQRVAHTLDVATFEHDMRGALADRIIAKAVAAKNALTAIDIIDTVLHLRDPIFFPGADDRLIQALREGRSAWDVSPDHGSLVRRVEPAAAELFALATSPEDRASAHLRDAWGAIYGLNVNPSAAWTSAIKACEAVLKPIVTPNNHNATMSDVVGILRSQPEQFVFRLLDNGIKPKSAVDPMATFEAMLHFVWVNPDRHEGKHYRDVPLEETTAVVHLAVTVVQWCRDGVLQRR